MMLGYVMIGTDKLLQATNFYDALLAPLGLVRDVNGEHYVGYSSKEAPEIPEFYLTEPFNKQPATPGNGTMIALIANSRELVDEFYSTGLARGGIDEGKPGPRDGDENSYYAYIRDPDGNKICAYCNKV